MCKLRTFVGPPYILPGNVIYATVGLVYINVQPECELPSSTRLGQFQKFWKNLSYGHCPPQPPLRKNIFTGSEFLFVATFTAFRNIHDFPMPIIRGYSRGSKVVPLDSTDRTSYLSLIVREAVSIIISKIWPSTCPTSLYLVTPLAFNPRRRDYPWMISIKF